jgi:hypothetical protein
MTTVGSAHDPAAADAHPALAQGGRRGDLRHGAAPGVQTGAQIVHAPP